MSNILVTHETLTHNIVSYDSSEFNEKDSEREITGFYTITENVTISRKRDENMSGFLYRKTNKVS